MSLDLQHHKITQSRYHGFFTLMLLFACVFAQCSVHAANDSSITQQSSHHGADSSVQSDHDCCEAEVECCEPQQTLTSNGLIDLPIDTMALSFNGLNSLIYHSDPLFSLGCRGSQLPTGPPIHLLHCRFTL